MQLIVFNFKLIFTQK